MRPALDELRRRLGENNYEESIIDSVIKQIEPFVGYGFNKSHSAAYAFIAYQCAYLKYYYPIEFYTALLTVFADNEEKAAHYIADAREAGIEVLVPDINESEANFAITKNEEIRYGFDSVKSLQTKAVAAILEKRPFASLEELIGSMSKSELSKGSVQALALSGAFDSLCPGEGRMHILQRALTLRGDSDNLIEEMTYFTNRERLTQEKNYLGAYLSGHPLDGVAKPVDWEEYANGESSVTALGIVNGIRRIVTKKGDPMAFINMTFLEHDLDVVCFPNTWESDIEFRKGDPLVSLSEVLDVGMMIKTVGRYEIEDGKKSYLLNRVSIPVRANRSFHSHVDKVQEEYGVIVPTEKKEEIEAPSMSWDSLQY